MAEPHTHDEMIESAHTGGRLPSWRRPPLLRAPERSRTIFLVSLLTAAFPLTAGVVLFGYRAGAVAMLSIAGCVVCEWAYFRITRTPALLGRSHAWLTGLLLALTLPASVAWYVPLVAAGFATIVGKAIFGGVGHFLWQPALLGRLAVAVIFSASINASTGPVLAPDRAITGDVRTCRDIGVYRGYTHPTALPDGVDGPVLSLPLRTLRQLSDPAEASYESIRDATLDLPEMTDVLIGATAGGIGETASIMLVLAGLYLVYRHYVFWLLPAGMILTAAAVAAIAPVHLLGAQQTVRTVWFPLTAEGADVGFTYVNYHLATGGLLLAAFFMASEMTTRPITRRGQVIFGVGCGLLGMLLRLYTHIPMPVYIAVLVMNTAVPLLDRCTRPRVLGRPPWWRRVLGRSTDGSTRREA